MTPVTGSTLGSHYFARLYVKSMSVTQRAPYILVVPIIGKIRDDAGGRTILNTLEVHTGWLSHLIMPLAIRISHELLTSYHLLLLLA
jgi:hypothetical protein